MSGNSSKPINTGVIRAHTVFAKKFVGLKDTDGNQQDVSLSASFDVTQTGFKLTDTKFGDDTEDGIENTTKNVTFRIEHGDIVLERFNSAGTSLGTDIVLDTSNQLSEFTDCNNLKITPSATDKVALTITGSNGLASNLVTIETNDGTDKFTIDNEGKTTIASSVLTTVDINGGLIDATIIGASSASSGAFTTITASTSLDVTGSAGIILQNGETITNSDSDSDTVLISGDVASGTHIFKSNGSHDVTLKTGTSTTTGIITIENETNGNIAITPKGTGEVDISKVDIDSGTIDNTVIGGTTPVAGTFNKLSLKVEAITNDNDINNPDKSIYYFTSSGSLSFGSGTDGQVIHIFYTNASGSLRIDFGSSTLVSGSGDSNSSLTFNISGQSATVIFIDSKWRIINTGAIVGQ